MLTNIFVLRTLVKKFKVDILFKINIV